MNLETENSNYQCSDNRIRSCVVSIEKFLVIPILILHANFFTSENMRDVALGNVTGMLLLSGDFSPARYFYLEKAFSVM